MEALRHRRWTVDSFWASLRLFNSFNTLLRLSCEGLAVRTLSTLE